MWVQSNQYNIGHRGGTLMSSLNKLTQTNRQKDTGMYMETCASKILADMADTAGKLKFKFNPTTVSNKLPKLTMHFYR